MRNLGVLYANGQGVRRDMAEATRWLEKAAAIGDAAAMVGLGNMYVSGKARATQLR